MLITRAVQYHAYRGWRSALPHYDSVISRDDYPSSGLRPSYLILSILSIRSLPPIVQLAQQIEQRIAGGDTYAAYNMAFTLSNRLASRGKLEDSLKLTKGAAMSLFQSKTPDLGVVLLTEQYFKLLGQVMQASTGAQTMSMADAGSDILSIVRVLPEGIESKVIMQFFKGCKDFFTSKKDATTPQRLFEERRHLNAIAADIGTYLARQGDFELAHTFLLNSSYLEAHANMMLQWIEKTEMSQRDIIPARIVLEYLSVRKPHAAQFIMDKYLNAFGLNNTPTLQEARSGAVRGTAARTPLINFVYFLLKTVQSSSASHRPEVYTALERGYSLSLKRDPRLGPLAAKVGAAYFGISPPNESSLNSLLKSLEGFLANDGDGDFGALFSNLGFLDNAQPANSGDSASASASASTSASASATESASRSSSGGARLPFDMGALQGMLGSLGASLGAQPAPAETSARGPGTSPSASSSSSDGAPSAASSSRPAPDLNQILNSPMFATMVKNVGTMLANSASANPPASGATPAGSSTSEGQPPQEQSQASPRSPQIDLGQIFGMVNQMVMNTQRRASPTSQPTSQSQQQTTNDDGSQHRPPAPNSARQDAGNGGSQGASTESAGPAAAGTGLPPQLGTMFAQLMGSMAQGRAPAGSPASASSASSSSSSSSSGETGGAARPAGPPPQFGNLLAQFMSGMVARTTPASSASAATPPSSQSGNESTSDTPAPHNPVHDDDVE